MTSLPFPDAVLLDVGGVFHLPGHETIIDLYRRFGLDVSGKDLNYAHYCGAARFHDGLDLDHNNTEIWKAYLDAHAEALEVPSDVWPEIRPHLDQAFAALDQWSHQIEGSVAGAEELKAAGVRIGIVSNADGTVAARLAESKTAQVGPGPGVDVEVIIDSGAVGITKPDARIFQLALDAMGLDPSSTWYVGDMPAFDVVGARNAGLTPILMDPHDLHRTTTVTRVKHLSEVADLVRAARN
ncbi:MAG: HAD family hydrolase [Acidimicrobiia bacterium]